MRVGKSTVEMDASQVVRMSLTEKCKHTRVVCSTFARRGKSLTPESSMDMLEDKSAFVERKDETQDASGFAILVKITLLKALERRCCVLFTCKKSAAEVDAEHERTRAKSGIGSL